METETEDRPADADVRDDTVQFPSAAPAPRKPHPVWRARFWIVGAVIVAGVVTYLVTSQISPVYRSTATARVVIPTSAVAAQSSVAASNDLAGQYAQLTSQGPVLDGATRRLEVASGSLNGQVSAGTIADTNLISVEADGSSPTEARRRANAVVDSLVSLIDTLNTRETRSAATSTRSRLAPLDAEIRQVRRQIASASRSDSEGSSNRAAALRDSLSQLIAERTRQASEFAYAQPAVRVYAPAVLGTKVEPRPVLYTIVAAIVAALAAAQLAVVRSRSR